MITGPDALISLRLNEGDVSPRKGPIATYGNRYGCPMEIDHACFDCVWLIGDRVLQLGESYDVEVAFLSPHLVLPILYVGKAVRMWERGIFAAGIVKEIYMSIDKKQ